MKKITPRQYAQALIQTWSATPSAARPKLIKHFWLWLQKRRATKVWPRILWHLRQIDDESQGRHRVTATVARRELIGQVTAGVKQHWGRQTAIDTLIDPRLVGGVKLRFGDTLYDGTIANSLQHLRQTLTTHYHE